MKYLVTKEQDNDKKQFNFSSSNPVNRLINNEKADLLLKIFLKQE